MLTARTRYKVVDAVMQPIRTHVLTASTKKSNIKSRHETTTMQKHPWYGTYPQLYREERTILGENDKGDFNNNVFRSVLFRQKRDISDTVVFWEDSPPLHFSSKSIGATMPIIFKYCLK